MGQVSGSIKLMLSRRENKQCHELLMAGDYRLHATIEHRGFHRQGDDGDVGRVPKVERTMHRATLPVRDGEQARIRERSATEGRSAPKPSATPIRKAVRARELALQLCVFKFRDDLVDRCYIAENKLIDQLWRLSQLDCAIGPMDSD